MLNSFGLSNTIDLQGVTVDTAAYDNVSHVLTLGNFGKGTNNAIVGTLFVPGDFTKMSFGLAKDSGSGIAVTLGPPSPDAYTLARLSAALYSGATQVDGYQEVGPGLPSSDGFLIEAFQNQDQLVIAIRGTLPELSFAALKNVLADVSFGSGHPTAQLQSYVSLASTFLQQMRTMYPLASISMTGHSLGGAIASLLGDVSGYTTTVFNAPGAGLLEPALTGQLAPALESTYSSNGQVTDYRVEGDQVSQIGKSIGQVKTLQSDQFYRWPDVLDDHRIETVVNDLQPGSGVPVYAGPSLPDAPLPAFVVGTIISQAAQSIVLQLTIQVGASLVASVDPAAANSYSLVEDSSSPLVTSITLPTLMGVHSYNVEFTEPTGKVVIEVVQSGLTAVDLAGSRDITFTGLDTSGSVVPIPDSFVFDLGFAAAGMANATLTETLMCFRSGTLILVEKGQARVEDLMVGDLVVTLSGRFKPIKWVGQRRVSFAQHPEPKSVLPVRVRAHAFGTGLPCRDLFLSPDHAIFADGVLIPVKYLIDHNAITQISVETAVYHHIELEHHDVLFAEGLPTESYLDTGDRDAFDGHTITTLHPTFGAARASQRWDALGYAPLVITGPAVERVRARVGLCQAVADRRDRRSKANTVRSLHPAC